MRDSWEQRIDRAAHLAEREAATRPLLQVYGRLLGLQRDCELRQWFNHDPLKWSQFRTRYFRELDSRPESWRPTLTAARRGIVTLLYSSHDEEHNNAVALKEYLQAKRRQPSSPRRSTAAARARVDR